MIIRYNRIFSSDIATSDALSARMKDLEGTSFLRSQLVQILPPEALQSIK